MVIARPFLVQALSLALLPGVTLAQFETANVLGTVKDGSGAVIVGGKVTLENSKTGVTFNTLSNDAGTFDFLAVQVGTYRLKAETAGFKTAYPTYRPNVLGDPMASLAQRNIHNYFNKANIASPISAQPPDPFGNIGRNTVRSYAIYQTDLGLHKEFQLHSEVRRLVFRCESFNLLNKTSFQAANSTSSCSAFGTIRSAFPARVIQMALKLVF